MTISHAFPNSDNVYNIRDETEIDGAGIMEEVQTTQVPDAREENSVTMKFGLDFAYHNWCYLQFEMYSIDSIYDRVFSFYSFVGLS